MSPLRRHAQEAGTLTHEWAIPERLLERLNTTLSAETVSNYQLLTVTIAAPAARPSHAFEQMPDECAFYFATRDRDGDVGLGTLVSLEATDLRDLPSLELEAQHILDHALEIGIDAAAKPPRFYGGIAYSQAPKPDGPWRAFGRVKFEIPRFRYLTNGQRASLTLHVRPHEVARPSDRAEWTRRTKELLFRLSTVPERSPARPTLRRRLDNPGAHEWLQQVESALGAMRKSNLEKVVLAREVELEFESPPDPARLLDSLAELSPQTTRFAFRKAGCVFLGATPERLVLRIGSEVRTEAVAGSIRALDTDAAEQLMRSEKERHEHDLVVRELVRKLELMGARPETSGRPAIRQLRHVLHLATTITARLFGPPHVLSLMSRLHPTPAVGGVPEAVAAEFMGQHEGFERGWYAAPIGWFDAQGDGEFVVALRSGLLEGTFLRLFAGAGIVSDSNPEKELQETELKLEGLLEALGRGSGTIDPFGPRRYEVEETEGEALDVSQ